MVTDLGICMAAVLTNERNLDVSKYSQQNLYNSLKTLKRKAFMDRKQEKIKMEFLGNFDLFFGISMVHPLNFTKNFAATTYSDY